MAPCNGYNGSYSADDGDLRVSLRFKTQKGCRPELVMDAERAYLRGLGDSRIYEVEDQQLRLVFDGGRLAFQARE